MRVGEKNETGVKSQYEDFNLGRLDFVHGLKRESIMAIEFKHEVLIRIF